MSPLPVTAVGALVLALVTGCSTPTDVTQSAGTAAASTPPSTVEGGDGGLPPELRAALPPCPTGTDVAEVPDGLPATPLPCLGPGDDVALSGLRGTPIVLNAWASWCQPCRAELPALAEFAEDAGPAVLVLGLNAIDDSEAAATLWAQLQMPFPSVADPDAETRGSLRWIGLPVTYLVDADGVIVHRHDGAITDAADWAALVEQHLEVVV